MTGKHRPSPPSSTVENSAHRRWLLLACLLLLILPGLACGNILPGPEATVPVPTNTAVALAATSTAVRGTATPTLYPSRTPTPAPTVPTATPTPLPPDVLRSDAPARVVARQGLNVREAPTASAKQLGRLSPGALVSVRDGPVEADGYRWWQVASGQGLDGWVADGDGEDDWLTGKIGEPRPVNRPVRSGDRVTVSTEAGSWLALRHQAAGSLIRRVPPSTQFMVKEGPVDAEGFRWWLLLDDEGMEGWAAESDRETRWLTPLE